MSDKPWTEKRGVVLRCWNPDDDEHDKAALYAFTHPDAPGLAVTRESEAHPWTVTHIASGRAMGRSRLTAHIGTQEEAQRFALRLAPLADWTRAMDAVLADRATISPHLAAIRAEMFGEETWDAGEEHDFE